MTILTAIWLSLYRIGDTQTNRSLYIALATINAVYCCMLFQDSLPLLPVILCMPCTD
jgi:hypothetical protein